MNGAYCIEPFKERRIIVRHFLKIFCLAIVVLGLSVASANAAEVSGGSGQETDLNTSKTYGSNSSFANGGQWSGGAYEADGNCIAFGSSFAFGGQFGSSKATRNSATTFGVVGGMSGAGAFGYGQLGDLTPDAEAYVSGSGGIDHETQVNKNEGNGGTIGGAGYTYGAGNWDDPQGNPGPAGAAAFGGGIAGTGGHVQITTNNQGTYGYAVSGSFSKSIAVGGYGEMPEDPK